MRSTSKMEYFVEIIFKKFTLIIITKNNNIYYMYRKKPVNC